VLGAAAGGARRAQRGKGRRWQRVKIDIKVGGRCATYTCPYTCVYRPHLYIHMCVYMYIYVHV
jgi:hypothetical protein